MALALRRVSFDGSLNIENQDPMMFYIEGFFKGREFLNRIIFHEPAIKIIY